MRASNEPNHMPFCCCEDHRVETTEVQQVKVNVGEQGTCDSLSHKLDLR